MRTVNRAVALIAAALLICSNATGTPLQTDTPAAPNVPDNRELQIYRQQLAGAHALARDGKDASAARIFQPLIEHPLFAALSTGDRRAALSAAAWSARRNGDVQRARAWYLQATAMQPDPDDWYRLALLEFDLGRYDEAAQAFVQLTEGWPELLGNIDEEFIFQLGHRLKAGSATRVAWLQALFDANWISRTGMASNLWYDLAVERIERGEPDAARVAIKRITSPMHLVRLRSDRRFDALVQASDWAFDVEHAARRQVDDLKLLAALHPTDLDIRVQLSYAMLMAGMHEEVLRLADEITTSIAQAPADEPPFADLDGQVWMMNNRAIALRRLGRTDEALAELQRARKFTEGGGLNVSQSLNLGAFLCSLGQPQAALDAVASVGQMSGYGQMILNSVQHCAARQLGNRRAARKALEYLRQHRQDGQLAYLEALVEAGRIDDAASALAELLASPTQRSDALEWVQEYRRPDPLPGDREAVAARVALLARHDVQQAIARVGRVARHEIYGDLSMR